ncbi:MAG: hypothetical protein GY737_13060 [Desulfobacteraceae bacterium]|nr:hypothetical protein [Desulfobacteraceae bacterium]
MGIIRSEDKNKTSLLQSATAEQIERYTERVRKGLVPCGLPPCPTCGLPPDRFKRHEKRKRKFHVVTDQLVVTLHGLLIRWKCPGCNKTRTDYPGFALPHKRYTRPTILAFSGAYVKDPISSYRSLINAYPLQYESKPDLETNQEQMMEHSTIHRWVTTLGEYSHTNRNATHLILGADPKTNLYRDLAGLTVPEKKYASTFRKQSLIGCFRLVFLESVFQTVFQISIFPKLATDYAYT